MGAILSELKTKVNVTTDTSQIDKAINSIDKDDFAPAIAILKAVKSTIENDIPSILSDRVAERIKSYQEQFIRMNGTVDTTQMVSTIFVEPSGQNGSEVGPTALSDRGFPYPIVIELGSVKYEGKPFVEPSLNYIQKDIQRIGLEVVKDKLRM
jgi:hypothetical protein